MQQDETKKKITAEKLNKTNNPALQRLAQNVQRIEEDQVTNYSRMHHRHNRSRK